MAENLKIIQVKSVISSPQAQRGTMSSLSLEKIRQSAVHPDNPAIRGQAYKVHHLITVKEID